MIKGLVHMTIIMIGICAGTFPVPAQLSAVKPDLRVEELSFVSVTRNAGKKMIRIQVLLRVKNIGMGPSGSFQIDGLIQQGPDKTESGCQETIKSQGLAPGATFVKVMIFNEPESVFRNQTFLFAVKADASGKVTETDETNNRSQVLSLKLPDH
jgi:CARDB